jgi:hypothetical protein
MGICPISVKGEQAVSPDIAFVTYMCCQLPNPDASEFSHGILQRAMLDTITALNEMAEEAGITEVTPITNHSWP